jgi:REP element-mobilizing transposase RayT
MGVEWYSAGVSNVHRLRLTDRIFFVNVNLRPRIRRCNESEYALLIEVLEASRRRLGFLLCGYVLMPDHGHALVWPHPASLRSGRKVVAHGARRGNRPSLCGASPARGERNHHQKQLRNSKFPDLPHRSDVVKSLRGWVLSPLRGLRGISVESITHRLRSGLRPFARYAGCDGDWVTQ